MTDTSEPKLNQSELKIKTAHTLKWNTIDRVASQVLYGVVGIVLANVVSQEDFGLIGALIVFQSFAIIFADSGFGAALLRKKQVSQADYSTVFWFNLIVSIAIYFILWFCSPLIADIFQKDSRLIPLSKVMFLTFVLNALAIVQTNRMMKQMDVKMIAISNLIAQIGGGGLGMGLALAGYGAWALVWQSVALAAIKTSLLWVTGKWRPSFVIQKASLQQIWRIGFSVFSSSMLNTIFLNVYSFIIGAFYSLRSLGVYTQADKWSKMGSASLSQILTSSFVPVLSKVQDKPAEFKRYVRKMNRFTSFLSFPFLIGLAAVGQPLFHTLFGNKWDSAIPLFQILCVRGVFIVLVSLFGNYMLALGYGKRLFKIEVIKDLTIAIAILSTIWFENITLLVFGQLLASIITFLIVVIMISKVKLISIKNLISDILPFCIAAIMMWISCEISGMIHLHPVLTLLIELAIGASVYLGIMWIGKFEELKEALIFIKGKYR